ncbi:TolC family protein [Sphingobacterium suaedae]|uniref:TolC family protein n=1 Tax=Sphingobacterium suaedae TaxID=1686402 RepID=A0ABW5KLW1_9SPHI
MIQSILAPALLWLAMLAVCPLYAQQAEEQNLGSLWPRVEEYYPGVAAKTSAIDAAAYHQQAVQGRMLPHVYAQAQNTYGTYAGSAGAFFPQAGFFNVSGLTQPLAGSTTAANTFASALVQWEVFSFGKLRKEREAAGALFHQSVSDKETYLLQLKKILSERYISLLYNHAKWAWTAKNAERLDDIRHITATLSASGLRPAADSLLASSSYVQALGEHDKWSGLRQAAYIHLAELHGTDTVDYTASAQRFGNPAEMPSHPMIPRNAHHPMLEVLNQQQAYYKASGEAQKRASLPSIHLLGGYAYRGTGIGPNGTVSGAWADGFSHTTNNVLAGIGITWNLTNLHINRLQGAQRFKEAERIQFMHARYERALQADLSASQAKIRQQYKQLQKTSRGVQQAQDAYRMYLARYKSGLITLSELLQIRLLLEQAENTHIEASRDYWMLRADEAEQTADFEFLFNNL